MLATSAASAATVQRTVLRSLLILALPLRADVSDLRPLGLGRRACRLYSRRILKEIRGGCQVDACILGRSFLGRSRPCSHESAPGRDRRTSWSVGFHALVSRSSRASNRILVSRPPTGSSTVRAVRG